MNFLLRIYTSLTPTYRTIGFTAFRGFGWKPQPSSGSYKCWSYVRCSM